MEPRAVPFRCSVFGAMSTLVVGMFSGENRYLATQAWSWRPLHRWWNRSSTLAQLKFTNLLILRLLLILLILAYREAGLDLKPIAC
jgi:hypothetical protein